MRTFQPNHTFHPQYKNIIQTRPLNGQQRYNLRMICSCKVIGIYSTNVSWIAFIKTKLDSKGHSYVELGVLSEETRNLYRVLDQTLWDDSQIDQFLDQ